MVQPMLSSVRDALYWAPPWLSGVAVLLIAVICALAVHRIIFFMFGRAFGERHPFLRALIRQSKGPLALALVAFALAAALQSAPFTEAVSAPVGRLLLIAFIVLAGWIAHIAVETGGRIYLYRFTVETADSLLARKHITQVRILKRALHTLIVVVTISAVLMTFDPVRQYGVSLFASAGVAGLVVGLAARPLLTNLIAGIQIATTQPIRIDDQVVVENESGRIEEITSTYVVVRLWDLRRLIVPLTLFIEKPFQNWTRELDQPDRHGVALCRFHRSGRSHPRQVHGDRAVVQAVGRSSRQAAGDRQQGKLDRVARAGECALGRGRIRSALRHPRAAGRVPAEGASDRAAACARGELACRYPRGAAGRCARHCARTRSGTASAGREQRPLDPPCRHCSLGVRPPMLPPATQARKRARGRNR